MIRRGHAVLPLAALAALALPAAAFCEAAGRYVPTYDAEKAWYLGELGVTNLLNAGITGKGVRVGVIDLGVGDIVTGAHTNLHCAAKGGKSMRAMHGPAVAGIIASDLYGVAPECEIYAYDNGDGTADDLIAGFAWCVSNGCRVINYSGGMHRFSRGVGNLSEEAAAAKLEELRAAVRAAMSAGIVVVASGGNAPNETLTCPQDVDGVINIGGVARTRKSAGLNDSWAKDFCAFGKDVPIFTSRSGATGAQSGSSFAAPMATGIIALLLQQEPSLTRDEIYGILRSTALRPEGGRTKTHGYGLLQAARVPADYKRQAAFDAEQAAFVRTDSAELLNEGISWNEERGFYETKMRPGESMKLKYRIHPANATDRNLYWYCGNMPTFRPIELDQVLSIPAKTKPGEFLVYFARNDARQIVCRLRVDVVAAEALLGAVPDATEAIEYIGNPAKNRWPANPYPRGVLDLQFHKGKLLAGSGEVEVNPGPVYLYGIDPVTLDTRFEYSAGTEAISNFRVASWGELLVPSQDPHEGDPNQAHVYIRGTNAVWRKYSSINGKVPDLVQRIIWNKTHIWDMEEFDGRVFTAGYQLHWSTNRCVKFVDTGSITNAHRPFYFMTPAHGCRRWMSLRRQMQFLRFADDLYAVPNSFIQPNYSAGDSAPDCNKVEVFHWNSLTMKFDESRQAMSTLFPNISSNDFRLVLSPLESHVWDDLPTGTYHPLIVRLWHTTPFKGRVLYVGCYDTRQATPALTSYPLPLMGCSATVQTSGGEKMIKADRISFDGDNEEYPWDFTVVGDMCYALTSKPNASTKIVRHSVWKSTDGTSFTRVLSFDFHQNMISLDYRDGWFWFGAGVKHATRGYAYDNKADEAGAIYRVRLPQEPTSVEAVNPPPTVAEGGSASIAFRLTAQPSSDMTLRVAARERRGVSLDKSSLTFTTSNWSTPQVVIVSLADDDVGDASRIIVQCGAFGDDIERGEFSSPTVTSATVFLSPIENDIPATVVSELFDFGVGTCTYRAKFDSFGSVNGVAAKSVTVSVKVYSDAALTAPAGQTSGSVSATGTEQSFTVTGLERGVWYWVVAETATAPNVSRVFAAKHLSPLAKPEELVDLMDDVDNREATSSNSTSGGATGSTAFDNKASNFGGYRKPVAFFYQFKTPMVVNGLGVWSQASGDTDRHPSTIVVYGGSSTNANDFVKLRSISESDWGYGEWRRWAIPNETAYKAYKITLTAQGQHCYVNELELYGIGVSPALIP